MNRELTPDSAPVTASLSPRGSRSAELALFVLLTVLVWGLFAADHGLWQDDALRLGQAFDNINETERVWFDRGSLPSRILVPQIYLAAALSGKPMFVLIALYGLGWLAAGLLAASLARHVSGDERVGFAAGCLTLTATSDYLTNSLVAVGYTISQALFMAALLTALRYTRSGSRTAFWLSPLLLAASIWMSDVGLIPMLATPIVLWLSARDSARRVVRVSAIWAVTAVPYVATLYSGLKYGAYAPAAVLHIPPSQRLERGVVHFAYNFTPWRWAFDRPAWFPEPPDLLPASAYVGATILGLCAFLWMAWRHRNSGPGDSAAAPGAFTVRLHALIFALVALGVNTAYASVSQSDAFYRTHLGARVWCSLGIAIVLVDLCDVAARRFRISRKLTWAFATLVTGGFVALGIWSGIERQDFYLASWRRHQRELRSLRDAAPKLDPKANVLLWREQAGTYLATEAGYLALAWMRLLQGRWPEEQIWVRSPSRRTECVGGPEGVRCRIEGCTGDTGCWSPPLPWESLVVIGYDANKGQYALLTRLPNELTAGSSLAAERYAPTRLIKASGNPLAGHLLAGDRLLGRWVLDARARKKLEPLRESVRLEFDEEVFDGEGWEPRAAGRSSRWMLAPETGIEIPIAGGSDRCLSVAISHYLAADIAESLQVTANGNPVPLQSTRTADRTIYTGIVPRASIPGKVATIDLRFRVNRLVSPSSLGLGADARPLGLLFDWLTLEPCGESGP